LGGGGGGVSLKSLSKTLSQKIQSLTFANAFGAKVEVGSKSCC
jgi:hypothetical protein